MLNTPAFNHATATPFQRPDKLHAPLYVVAPVINAARFRTRWKLYADFAKHVADAGAILYTVEVAFGDRDFVVTDKANPQHIQFRTHHELWLKERAINLGVARLPQDWQYVAWIDPDCAFTRPDWANETLHQLQHYPLIQMWSQLTDVTPNYEVSMQLRSFMDIQLNGVTPEKKSGGYQKAMIGAGQKFGSPGLAWAARREAWNALGGVIDFSILGAGDWYFASVVMDKLDELLTSRDDLTPGFVRKLQNYQEHAQRGRWEGRSIVGNVGLMPGLCIHYWHGPRVNRQYSTRGAILIRHEFDPDRDLLTDWQGLFQLSDRSPKLRREIQQYFSARNEDQL